MTDKTRLGTFPNLPENPLLRYPLMFFAVLYGIFIDAPYQACCHVSGKVYKGWDGWLFHFPVGIASGFGVATLAGWVMGTAGDSLWVWFPVSCLAFFLGTFLVYPAFVHYVYRPVEVRVKKFLEWTRALIKAHFGKVVETIVNAAKVLPFSSTLWRSAEGEAAKNSGFLIGLAVILGVTLLGAAGFAAYSSYVWVLALFPESLAYVPTATAAFSGLVVFAVIVGLLVQLFEVGEFALMGITYSGAGVYFLAPVIDSKLGTYGVAAVWTTYLASFVLGLAYIFPGLNKIATGGLVKRAVKWWATNMLEPTYSEADVQYRLFFSHTFNLVLSFVFAYVAFVFSINWGLNSLIGAAAAAAVFASTYMSNPKMFEDRDMSGAWGVFAAFGLPLWLGHMDYLVVTGWKLFVVEFLVGLFTALVVWPVFYKTVRLATFSWLSEPAGRFLASTHKKIYEGLDWLSRKYVEKVLKPCFTDESQANKLFVHLVNLAILFVGGYQAVPSLSTALESGLGLTSVSVVSILAVGAVISYVVIGNLLVALRNASVAALVGLIATGYSGVYVYHAANEYSWLGFVVGPMIGCLAAGLIFPLFYQGLVTLLKPVAPALEPSLTWVLEKTSDLFIKAWDKVWVALKMLGRIWKPIWRLVVSVWAAIWKVIGPIVTRVTLVAAAFLAQVAAVAGAFLAQVAAMGRALAQIWTHRG